ncbi:MAG: OsmC family protein [Bacteroidia bacterium]|nr:OsmC family protein [Bacteroidia bacterium]
MKNKIEISWIDTMAFETHIDGHTLYLDAAAEFGGKDMGPMPKNLMMVSLAGCSGMDVASLLKKMEIAVEEFKVSVDGDLTEEHPKHFYKMHMIYQFKGNNLPLDKLEHAVKLSQEKYCGVAAVLKKALELTWEIRIL